MNSEAAPLPGSGKFVRRANRRLTSVLGRASTIIPSGLMCARRLAGARRPALSAGSPSRPDPRSGRRRARLSLLPVLTLLLGALLLFTLAPASAAELVSNTDQTTGLAALGLSGRAISQGFTTGNAAHGYRLTNVVVSMDVVGTLTAQEIATVKAELWINSDNVSRRPYSKWKDLSVPSSIASGTVTFTASDIVLQKQTIYHVVVYGLPLFGERFTGTPNVGFGMPDGGAQDWRVGWRLTSAAPGDAGFEINLDATRSKPANDNEADHALMLRGAITW